MPYSKISEARLKKLDDVDLTLSQVNEIARMADAIGGDKGWPIAIYNFKKSHKIVNGHWEKDSNKEKEFSSVNIEKQANGKYRIVAISTAAIKDKEDETFTTQAIDYDAAVSKETGQYPEFRVFHSKGLGIGKVLKMSRVGIFAVDEGESYDDPFSLEVCEKMLKHNESGRWRVSRGFRVLEASGICPECGEDLLIRSKHMLVGFRCPTCKSVNMGTQGSLKSMRFLKARTFDVTITDTPAVPWTGVTAFPLSKSQMEDLMATKKELKKRLLEAGMEESIIDDRLKMIPDEKLKEFDDIPTAVLLKEFQAAGEEDSDDLDEKEKEEGDNTFVLDPTVLKEFSKIVKVELKEALENLEVEVEEDESTVEKEEGIMAILKELTTKVDALGEVIQSLQKSDEEKLKELMEETPRKGLLVLRSKSKCNKPAPEEDSEDEMDDEEEPPVPPKSKKSKEFGGTEQVLIMDSDGNRVQSMTDFVHRGEK